MVNPELGKYILDRAMDKPILVQGVLFEWLHINFMAINNDVGKRHYCRTWAWNTEAFSDGGREHGRGVDCIRTAHSTLKTMRKEKGGKMINAIFMEDNKTKEEFGQTKFYVYFPLKYEQLFDNEFLIDDFSKDDTRRDIKIKFCRMAGESLSNLVFKDEKDIVLNALSVLSGLKQDKEIAKVTNMLIRLSYMLKVEVFLK